MNRGTRATYSGGCRCDDCRAANRAYSRANDPRLPANRGRATERGFVDSAPLFARITSALGVDANDEQIAEACGVSRETVQRWRRKGRLRVVDTDRVAIALGWHPAAVWGADWYIEQATRTN